MMSMKRLWESVEIGNKVRESVTCCLDSRLSQSRTPGQGAEPRTVWEMALVCSADPEEAGAQEGEWKRETQATEVRATGR